MSSNPSTRYWKVNFAFIYIFVIGFYWYQRKPKINKKEASVSHFNTFIQYSPTQFFEILDTTKICAPESSVEIGEMPLGRFSLSVGAMKRGSRTFQVHLMTNLLFDHFEFRCFTLYVEDCKNNVLAGPER